MNMPDRGLTSGQELSHRSALLQPIPILGAILAPDPTISLLTLGPSIQKRQATSRPTPKLSGADLPGSTA